MFQTPTRYCIQKPMESVHFLWILQKPLKKKGSSSKVHPWDLEFAMSPDQGAQLSRVRIVFCCGLLLGENRLDNPSWQIGCLLISPTSRVSLIARTFIVRPSEIPAFTPKAAAARANTAAGAGKPEGAMQPAGLRPVSRPFSDGLEGGSSEHGWLENHLSFHRRLKYIFNPGPFSSQLCYSTRAILDVRDVMIEVFNLVTKFRRKKNKQTTSDEDVRGGISANVNNV